MPTDPSTLPAPRPLTIVRAFPIMVILVETTLSNWVALAFRVSAPEDGYPSDKPVGRPAYYGRLRTALHYSTELAEALAEPGAEVFTSETTTESLVITPGILARIERARHMPANVYLIPPPGVAA